MTLRFRFLLFAAGASLAVSLHGAGPGGDNGADRVKVYNVESGMSAPELMPATLPEDTFAPCSKKSRSVLTTNIYFIVDATGQPRNLYFESATGTELDKIALRLTSADHFKPAVLNGEPIATWAVMETEFQVCTGQKKVGKSKMVNYSLGTPPIQTLKQGTQSATEAVFAKIGPPDGVQPANFKMGSGVAPPRPVISPQAEYTDDARKKEDLRGLSGYSYRGCARNAAVTSHHQKALPQPRRKGDGRSIEVPVQAGHERWLATDTDGDHDRSEFQAVLMASLPIRLRPGATSAPTSPTLD